MSDSLIRVRQVNKPEFSGYTVEIIKQYLTTGSVTISGSGILTGSFYPLNSNPSGYLTGQVVRPSNTGNLVDTTALALQTNSILSQVSGLYYPKSNPSGYLTRTSGDSIYVSLGPTVNTGQLIFDDSVDAGYAIYFIPNKFFALHGTGNSVIDLYNNSGAYISGFAVKSNDIQLNGKTVLNDETKFAHVTKTDAVTYNQSFYLYDAIKTAFPFAFNDGSEFFMSGLNGAIIDLYDSTRSTTTPYISGFDIYSTGIWLNGVPITGLNTTGVTQAQLLATSGVLDADIQDVRSDVSGLASRIGPPTGVPQLVYLNTVPQQYISKGLIAYSSPQEVFNYIASGGSGLYKIVVGTGTFPEGILSGTTGNNPANLFKFGEIVFSNEYDANVHSPVLDLQFRNCSGRVRLDNSVYAGFQCTTGVLAFDSTEKFPRDVNNGPLVLFTDITGAINNFRIDTFFIGGTRTNVRIDNCYIDAMLFFGSGLSGLNVTNSEIPAIGIFKSPLYSGWLDRYTATNSQLGRTMLLPASRNGIPLSFSGAPIAGDTPNYVLPSGWGGLGYSPSGLFLVKSTGALAVPDQIITKTTGDSLYYSITNPTNYVTQSYVSSNYASLGTAAWIGDTGHNNSFYLWHSGVDVLAFNSAQNLFRLTPRTGSAYIDVVNGIISGFKVDASSLLISGSGVGNNTGTFASIDDYTHNSRFGLVSTGSNVTGFYFGGGNNPYYLQGVFRFENGALQYNNLIDLQNSIISGFSIYNVPTLTASAVSIGGAFNVSGPATFQNTVAFQVGVTLSGSTLITTANTGGFVTTVATGSLLVGKNVTGIYSGSFYPLNSNPSGYLTGNTGAFATTGFITGVSGILSAQTNATGNFLYGLIQASSAGVSSLNGISGSLVITGAGGVAVTATGQTITISGNTSLYVTTGSTGIYTGSFYPLNSNPSGYLTAGNTGIFVTTGDARALSFTQATIATLSSSTGTFSVLNVGASLNVTGPGSFGTSLTLGGYSVITTNNPVGVTVDFSGPVTFNGAVTFTGKTPVTTADTGALANSFVSFAQTGSFYPRLGNPSGFLTGSTGGFVTATQTGNLLVGKNQTGIFTDSFVDKFEVEQVVIPGLSFGSSEGDQVAIWGNFIGNAMTNWQRRGGTINTYLGGAIVSISNPENTVEPVFGTPNNRAFAAVTRTGAGTAVFEFTGLTLATPSHAAWQPYFVVRSMPSLISGVGMELLNNSNVWETAYSGTPLFTGMLCAGPYSGFTGFPVKGVRFSLQYISTATGTMYINEFGITNKNYIKGGELYAFEFDSPTFTTITATGLIVSGSSVVSTAQTGSFYPRLGNPSGFITGSTGGFVSVNQTGLSLVGKNQTGDFLPISQGGQVVAAISGYNLISNRYGFAGGIYTFQKGINSGASANVFSVTNQNGTQIFDVMINCSSNAYSVSKAYSVAHSYGATPVANLKVSTGPYAGQDFNVEFFQTGANVSGLAMKITNVGTVSGNFVATMVLGACSFAPIITEL